MVAKKTAVQQSATGSSTTASGDAAEDVGGKRSTHRASAGRSGGTATGKGRARKTAAGKSTARKAAESAAAEGAESAEAGVIGGAATGRAANDGAAAGKPVARKAAAKRTPAKKIAAKRTAAAKSTARKTVAKKAAGKSTAKTAGAAQAAEQTGATTVVAKKTPGTATAAKSGVPQARVSAAVVPGELAVRPGEDPWTPEEVAQARAELTSEGERLRAEITSSERAVAGLMRDSGDGAGDDQADTGTKNITREHELALAANAQEMLTQTERALERLDAGTYGLCENCGNPIGKARMQAFPRATLCVECKQKQERRY
ncbi:TraR/DksA C4-type zinc finger protein [Streptomyces sp. NPDC000983]|uniref:TraR/DksA C4-type zinc finger protein n=1 Tax=Streptomyces sp. NPDC000983 TaxID=3154373 RepID=UPI00331905E6